MHDNYDLRQEQLNKASLLSSKKFLQALLDLFSDRVVSYIFSTFALDDKATVVYCCFKITLVIHKVKCFGLGIKAQICGLSCN